MMGTPKDIPCITDPINHLDIGYKESIISLLFLVQGGRCSCRNAATLLMNEHNRAFVSYAKEIEAKFNKEQK